MTERRLSVLFGSWATWLTTSAVLGWSILLNLRSVNFLDEGMLLHVAHRLAQGEVLYRDVVTGVMPGAYYLQMVLLRLFGEQVWVGRILMALLLLATCLLLARILHLLGASRRVALVSMVLTAALLAGHWKFPSYSVEALVLILSAMLLLLGRQGPRRILLAGLLLGIAFLFKQNYAVFAGFAIGMWLVAGVMNASSEEWRPGWREVGLYVGATVLPTLVVMFWFMAHGALGDWIEQVVYVPLHNTVQTFYMPFPPLAQGWEVLDHFFVVNLEAYSPFGKLHAWLIHSRLIDEPIIWDVVRIVYYLPLLLLLLSAGAWIIGRWGERDRRLLLVILMAGWMVLGMFPRADYQHWVYVVPFLVPPIVWLLHQGWHRGGRLARLGTATSVILLVLWGVVKVAGDAAAFFHPERDKREITPVKVRHLAAISTGGELAHSLRRSVAYLSRRAGEPLLVVPSASLYYFLTDRPNPTRYPLILPGALDEGVVIEEAERAGVRQVVYSDETIDGRTLRQDLPRIHAWLRSHFRIDEEFPIIDARVNLYILERREPPIEWTPDGIQLIDLFEPDGVREVMLDGRVRPIRNRWRIARTGWLFRDALRIMPGFGPSKSVACFRGRVSPGMVFRAGVGLHPRVWDLAPADGALFEVWLRDDQSGRLRRLASRWIDPQREPGERGWIPLSLSLDQWAGRDVTLLLATAGGMEFNRFPGEPRPHNDLTGWAEPRLTGGHGSGDWQSCMVDQVLKPAERRKLAGYDDIAPFEAWRRLHPERAGAHLAVAHLYRLQGRAGEALEAYLRAARAGFSEAQVWRAIAALALQRNRLETARKALDRLLEERPDDLFANLRLAGLHLRQGDVDGALAVYRRLVRQGVDHVWVWIGLADASLRSGDVAAAQEAISRALPRLPDRPYALRVAGNVARAAGEVESAVIHYRKALKLLPPDHPAAEAIRHRLRELERSVAHSSAEGASVR